MVAWTLLATAPLAALAVIFLIDCWKSRPDWSGGGFGLPDAFAGSLLALFFLFLVADSTGERQQITIAAIAGSAIVYGGLVIMLNGFLAVRGVSLCEAFRLKSGERNSLAIVGLASVACIPLVLFTQSLVSWFLPESAESQPLLEFWTTHSDLTGRFLVVVMASVVAPICEEWIFRGYLYGVARRYVGPLWSMFVVSLLFAAIHLHLPAMPGLFLLGVVFTVIYERTGTLWAPIAVHSVFNTVSLAASLLWPDMA
ncbi:MAG: hypothetical protein Fur0032_22210 [Terrimicrobiaceae bacterium]